MFPLTQLQRPGQPADTVGRKSGVRKAVEVVGNVMVVLVALFILGLGCGLFFAGCQAALRLMPTK